VMGGPRRVVRRRSSSRRGISVSLPSKSNVSSKQNSKLDSLSREQLMRKCTNLAYKVRDEADGLAEMLDFAGEDILEEEKVSKEELKNLYRSLQRELKILRKLGRGKWK